MGHLFHAMQWASSAVFCQYYPGQLLAGQHSLLGNENTPVDASMDLLSSPLPTSCTCREGSVAEDPSWRDAVNHLQRRFLQTQHAQP